MAASLRRPHDLTVWLLGDAIHRAARTRLLNAHGWRVEEGPAVRTDLELACRPGNGRFTGRADCRVLAVFDSSLADSLDTRQAHVVLSADGQIGNSDQVRLRLSDADGFWRAMLGEQTPELARAAA